MTRVLIRADASAQIGSGHVARCLALATALKQAGAEVSFVSREYPGSLCKVIESSGYVLHRLPALPQPQNPSSDAGAAKLAGSAWRRDARETVQAVGQVRFDWLIVDHYALGRDWEDAVGVIADKILVIDDLADRFHSCDILLDQNLTAGFDQRYGGLVPPRTTLLLGPSYALLQPIYSKLRKEAAVRSGKIRHMLVSFGGADNLGLTETAVEALLAIEDPELQVDIVLPSESPSYHSISEMVQEVDRMQLKDRQPSLAPFMLRADIAVGAGGSTNWERLCLGLPALVATVADNQRPIVSELNRLGLVRDLGSAPSVEAMKSVLRKFLERELDPQWSQACFEVVDGLGAHRVCEAMGLAATKP